MKLTRIALLCCLTISVTAGLALAADSAGDHSADAAAPTFITQTLVAGVTAMIIFLLSLIILGKFAWKPIIAGLNGREQRIRSDIDRAEQARVQAEALLTNYKKQVANADAEVREKLATAQKDAEAVAARLKMQAQTDIEDMKKRAAADIDAARAAAIAQLRQESAELGTTIASKILKRNITDVDQAELIRSSLEELTSTARR
jgi:F-type H+-transporting ATPase subunit b